MTLNNFIYIITLLFSVLFPILYSFDKRVRFYTHWKALFIAITIPAIFFILWDIYFTKLGIWSFNNEYILGFRMLELPIEEWLFFIIIPYCSLFVYEVLKSYLPNVDFNKALFLGLILLVTAFLLLALFNFQQTYTFWNFTFNTIFLVILLLNNWFLKHRTHFMLTFVICLIPMLIVNSILTALPIVMYNPSQIMGIRIFSIPFEDFFYYFLLLMMNLFFYEKLLKRTV
jgi:lycopene cyclase domain-containing protein